MNLRIFTFCLGVALCFFSSVSIVSAQKSTFFRDTHIRVEGGGTVSKVSNIGSDSEALFSYRAGLSASMPIYLSNFRVNTGLFITQKGEEAYNGGGSKKARIAPSYLILPVDLSYRLDVDDHFAIDFSGGPYFGVGIISSKESYTFGRHASFGDKEMFKRMEVGIGLNGMVEYDNFSVKAGGEIGLTRATSTAWLDTPRNYQIYIMLGYRLFNW